jgi:hypothetical protein
MKWIESVISFRGRSGQDFDSSNHAGAASMPTILWTVAGVACIAAAACLLWLLDRLLLRMEARGWIYYRKKQPEGGTFTSGVSASMREMDRLLTRPSIEHVIEAEESVVVKRENDGA